MLTVVSATRQSPEGFRRDTALGRSLERLAFDVRVRSKISFFNGGPLAVPYNRALATAEPDETLLFVHDDAALVDWFVADRLEEALDAYDVVGVAGNRRRLPEQTSWAFAEAPSVWDHEHLSGAVGTERVVGRFGPAPAEVKSLDGVFLAARAGVLRGAGVRFDPRFPFHLYDLDFCRSCEAAGLRQGTWPIAILHESGGTMGSPNWHAAWTAYLAKWGE